MLHTFNSVENFDIKAVFASPTSPTFTVQLNWSIGLVARQRNQLNSTCLLCCCSSTLLMAERPTVWSYPPRLFLNRQDWNARLEEMEDPFGKTVWRRFRQLDPVTVGYIKGVPVVDTSTVWRCKFRLCEARAKTTEETCGEQFISGELLGSVAVHSMHHVQRTTSNESGFFAGVEGV
uniref:Uncharacterized protein n=2 Tax=Meloidogyne TaxID=189290 RepID=A0A6V7U1Q4_MELEN|nr:unnamed protein product [Meloidogyne enterolobii]